MIRIIIAEDHIVVAEGFKALLNAVDGISIIKTVENGKILLEYMQNNPVDLIIMDVMMPVLDGLETTKIIKKEYPDVKVLVLSVSHTPLHVQTALDAGVDGYLLKETNKQELVNAIHLLMEGKTYYAQKATSALIKKSSNITNIKLTQREIDVLKLLSLGDSTAEIAIKLNLGESTIKTYRVNLVEKFKVKNTVALMRKAMEGGFI